MIVPAGAQKRPRTARGLRRRAGFCRDGAIHQSLGVDPVITPAYHWVRNPVIISAERRLPVRIRLGVPPGRFGQRHAQITAWLDENCGADGWAMTPSGMRGVLNDAVSVYFLDATLASAFVAWWCAGYKVETAEGVFQGAIR
jgi:hypothetical protein